MKGRLAAALITVTLSMAPAACVSAKRPVMPAEPAPPGASLWKEPADLEKRDLFHGPWGPEHAPDPKATYRLVEYKHTGVNLGMTVKDPQGREWSVKQPYAGNLDSEAPVEITLSRLLSAIGYHQPPIYFLPEFTLKDDWGTHTEIGGRFRLKMDELDDIGLWRWDANPFIGSKPHGGLLTLLMMFNSTDFKNSNNTLYEYKKNGRVEQWYVARDIGSALGDTHRITPRKNHPDSFEHVPFITGVTSGRVDFAYDGWYKNFVNGQVKPEDVVWVMSLLARLSEQQWQDAFRAGGYDQTTANRFIRKLRQKMAEGQALKP